MKSEAPPIAYRGESEAKPLRDKKHWRSRGAWGGWRRNVWKCTVRDRGGLSWAVRSGAGVRVPVVAGKRPIPVEPRGAGRWRREGNTRAIETAGSAAG